MLVLRVQQIPNVIQEVTPVLGGATLNRAFQRTLRCGVVTEATAATLRRRRRNYYAWQHNRKGENTTPILIEFEASDDAVSIDGRDFL
jgi:hypothetical protein